MKSILNFFIKKKHFRAFITLKSILSLFISLLFFTSIFLFIQPIIPGILPQFFEGNSSANLFGQTLPGDDVIQNYDYILVIDESGSMRKNDPKNMRIDAAKLFVYLSETLNKGNRVLVSGFGENTNIYLPLTDIEGNEDEISAALDKIKSNQQLTDMKGALEKIKQTLDERREKRETIVIFLTDGALTIDDIPPEPIDIILPERDRTGRTIISPDSKDTADDGKDTAAAGKSSYLKNYKEELLELCYEYKHSGIIIHPIAFTSEAEVEILEQMASITDGICYKPEEAIDLKEPFIDILKVLSRRFIKIQRQEQPEAITGEIPVKSFKEIVIMAIKNDYVNKPNIELLDPSGIAATYDEFIQENILEIVKINAPDEGNWKYILEGDCIFVYDIIDFKISEPRFLFYTTNATIPIKIQILNETNQDFLINKNDFLISAALNHPVSGINKKVSLDEDKAESDKLQTSVFSGVYSGSLINGYYNVAFALTHLPTNSVSGGNMGIDLIDFPVNISIVEPSKDTFILGEEVKIIIKLEKDADTDEVIETGKYLLSFNLSGNQGTFLKDVMLLDSGVGADEKAGDGLYSAIYTNTYIEDNYRIDFFIKDASMTEPVSTGLFAEFELIKAPEVQPTTQIEKKVDETTLDPVKTSEQETSGKTSVFNTMPLYIYIIIIAAVIILIVLIILIVFLLRKKQVKRKK